MKTYSHPSAKSMREYYDGNTFYRVPFPQYYSLQKRSRTTRHDSDRPYWRFTFLCTKREKFKAKREMRAKRRLLNTEIKLHQQHLLDYANKNQLTFVRPISESNVADMVRASFFGEVIINFPTQTGADLYTKFMKMTDPNKRGIDSVRRVARDTHLYFARMKPFTFLEKSKDAETLFALRFGPFERVGYPLNLE